MSAAESPHPSEAEYDFIVITTATLPWLTGPSYVSLWHASGLTALGYRVLYRIPWIQPACQRRLWGRVHFQQVEAQFAWLAEEAGRIGCPRVPAFSSYPGYYSKFLRSILPRRPVVEALPDCRVLILMEPEHLAWHPATPPRRKMPAERVVGLVVTNYPHYVAKVGWPGAQRLSHWVDRYHRRLIDRHTDLAFSISPAPGMESLFRPEREARLTGVLCHYAQVPAVTEATRGAYFLGRMVWEKALDQVIEMARHTGIPVDLYGDGQDTAAIGALAQRQKAPIRLMGPHSSFWEALPDYRVFLNPSRSEVLCTATADALVAGRHVVLARCPGNRPFEGYANAHFFEDMDEAIRALRRAMEEAPLPPDEIRRDFDWMNACRNLARLSLAEPGRPS